MNATIKNAKEAAALRQITELRQERDRLVAGWTDLGWEKTQEACEAIGEQIQALYEELDALEAGETTQAGRSENEAGRGDEVGVTPAELAAVAYLGWGREELAARKIRGR